MPADGERKPAAPATLPRGRHKLPPHVVRASQRERLLQAMLELVSDRGYTATTVPLVVARARVSRNAFYDLWSDKTECFLELCDDLSDEILDQASVTDAPDWITAMRTGTERYLRWWAERPEFSRTYFVELPAAGPAALEQRDRQYARFRALFEASAAWARHEQPGLPPLRPLAVRAAVLAITELIAEEIRAGRTGRLGELAEDVLYLLVLLVADEATARRAVGA